MYQWDKIKVIGNYDTVVVGGGTAGAAAGIRAAKEGNRVLIVEKSLALGGAAVNALVNPMMESFVEHGEIFHEIERRLKEKGVTTRDGIMEYVHSTAEAKALVLEEMFLEYGGGILYDAVLTDCNVSDYSACEKMAKDIMETYGHLDILVNNAGITRDDLLMKMSEEAFDAVIATNLKGTFNTIRHFSRYLLKQRSGTIINLSSVSGILGNAGQANYSASKAGVIGLTKSVARELSSRGITCNAVAPGFIDTEMTAQMTDKAKEAVKTQIPLGRVGKVDDIAEVVTFLASEKASYITGQVISVDGGMSI